MSVYVERLRGWMEDADAVDAADAVFFLWVSCGEQRFI
jgi:hypothetical protein